MSLGTVDANQGAFDRGEEASLILGQDEDSCSYGTDITHLNSLIHVL
jgi:hypothetical protein